MEDKLDDGSPRPPDLQEWIARYGGRPNIPWDKWDAAIAEYQRARRAPQIRKLESPASNQQLLMSAPRRLDQVKARARIPATWTCVHRPPRRVGTLRSFSLPAMALALTAPASRISRMTGITLAAN